LKVSNSVTGHYLAASAYLSAARLLLLLLL